MKKSQAATEFLMTYGWAILILMVVVAGLFSLGVFNPKISNNCKAELPFFCTDVLLDKESNLLSVSIRSSNIKYAGYDLDDAININNLNCPIIEDGDPFPINLDNQLSDIKTKYVKVQCKATNLNIIEGDEFNGEFNLNYTEMNGLNHNIKIIFSGIVE